MTPTKRLRLLADYLAATRNEIAVDEMLLGMAHVTPVQVGYLPRVPHWLSRAIRAPSLTRAIWRLGRILWLSGGALAYFAMELLKFDQLRRRMGKAPTKSISLTQGAVLGFSTRVSDVVDNERFPWLPTIWLTCPWARQHSLPKDAVELPLMSLITGNDLREAFACALRATYALAHDPNRSPWVLQSYTAFRWFMVRCAVDRIAGTLVTTEHFDRWAVLADRAIRADRQGKMHARKLVVVQHGALGGLGSTNHDHDALKQLPTRLSCVDELHTYNANEENTFRRAVLTKTRSGSSLRVRYFSPTITLSGESSTDRPRLLFVGHPLCEVFQKAVYMALRESIAVEAFYKPHPIAPMSASMAGVGWKIIDNPKLFPRVELLVSYPSTLVIEYEGAGVPASVHPIDICIDAIPQFLEQTLQKIKKNSARTSCAQ
jgi:hypothetical protein